MNEIIGRPDEAARFARRDFLRAAGLGGAAVALAACGADVARLTQPTGTVGSAGTGTNGNATGTAAVSVTLDFSSDIGVLNYAYALEQLEAAFYTQVVANAQFGSIFSTTEQRLLTDVRDHEVAHREFFKAALASAAIPGLTPNFSSINFASRSSVLSTAMAFEDLGVSAYNGAGHYLQNVAYLTLAGKIVSVEARHASAIRDVLMPKSSGANGFAPNAFDAPNTPATVLNTAKTYITDTITIINA